MQFDSGALRAAHGALRAYAGTNNVDVEPAHDALSTLVVAAQRQGDLDAADELIRARDMLRLGRQGATAAEAVLERLEAR